MFNKVTPICCVVGLKTDKIVKAITSEKTTRKFWKLETKREIDVTKITYTNTCNLVALFPISFVVNDCSASAGSNVWVRSDGLEVARFSCCDDQKSWVACPSTQMWDTFRYDFGHQDSSVERFLIGRSLEPTRLLRNGRTHFLSLP